MPAAALSSLHTASIDGTSKSSTRFHTAEMRVPHSVTYTYSNQTEVSDMVSILTMVGKGRPTTRNASELGACLEGEVLICITTAYGPGAQTTADPPVPALHQQM